MAAFVGGVESPPDAGTVVNANDRSLADWNRAAGAFCRQRCTIRSRTAGTFAFAIDGASGSSFRIATIVSAAVAR